MERPWRTKQRRLHRCLTCGGKLSPRSKHYCDWHLDERNAYYRTWRKNPEHRKHIREHQRRYRKRVVRPQELAERQRRWYTCIWCGQRIDPAGEPRRKRWHAACATEANISRVRWLQQKQSGAYRESHRRAARAYQERQEAAGRCKTCGRDLDGGGLDCRRCARRDRLEARARRARSKAR